MTGLAVVITLCFIYFLGYLYVLIMQSFYLYWENWYAVESGRDLGI